MKNKSIAASVLIGVAALIGAGLLLSRSKKGSITDPDLAAEYKSKLGSLKRKATREFKNTGEDVSDAANVAKERATQWINKSGANL